MNNFHKKINYLFTVILLILPFAIVFGLEYFNFLTSFLEFLIIFPIACLFSWLIYQIYLEQNVHVPIDQLEELPDEIKTFSGFGLDGYAVIKRRTLLGK